MALLAAASALEDLQAVRRAQESAVMAVQELQDDLYLLHTMGEVELAEQGAARFEGRLLVTEERLKEIGARLRGGGL